MLRLIAAEVIKLKRSKIVLISLGAAAVMPILNTCLLMQYDTSTIHSLLRQTHLFFTIIAGTLVFGLITTYTFVREFEEDTMRFVLSLPVNRTALLVSKALVLLGWILGLMMFAFALCVVLGSLAGFSGLTAGLAKGELYTYLLTGTLFFALTPPVVLVALVFRSYIPPLAFATVVTFLSVILPLSSKYMALLPWTSVLAITGRAMVESPYPLSYSVASILLTSVIFSLVIVVYWKNTDIH